MKTCPRISLKNTSKFTAVLIPFSTFPWDNFGAKFSSWLNNIWNIKRKVIPECIVLLCSKVALILPKWALLRNAPNFKLILGQAFVQGFTVGQIRFEIYKVQDDECALFWFVTWSKRFPKSGPFLVSTLCTRIGTSYRT